MNRDSIPGEFLVDSAEKGVTFVMQYNHRSRLPPPPPFGRGRGGPGYPRGHKQLYYAPPPPPPFPPAPPPPERKYEVLMEAGRLAAEYLVSQGALPPAALQRGAGSSGAWGAHPLPLPPPQQLQEPHGFYGRRRYEDEYSNNPGARPRRANSTSSSTSSRDDYNSGSYNGRGKRKYGEYRRGYDSGRDREKERGRSSSNGRRNEEDEDEDGAPGFRRERRGCRWSDEVRSSVTEAVREEAPLTAKAVAGLDMENTRSKIVRSVDDVRKDADAAPEVTEETEEGEMEDDSEALNSESDVVNQERDTDVSNASAGVVMESEPKQLPDGKIQDEVPDEEAEDDKRVLDEAALDNNTSDGEVTYVENDMHDGKKNLIDYCNFTRAPTRPRSVRGHRNASSVPGEAAVAETVNLLSSGQASEMVIGESANESSLTNIESENREDQVCQQNTNSGAPCAEPIEPMLLQENETSMSIENMAEEKVDAQPHVVQEYKEETNLSPVADAHKENLMQETSLSPFTASHKDSLAQEDGLMQETDLSPLTANHRDSLIEETTLPPLAASHKEDSLTQETELSRTISSHENNLKLQFKEGTQNCDIDMLPQDVDLIELSDERKVVGHDVGAEAVIKMEEGKLDQSFSLNLSDLDLVGGTEVAAIHDNPALVQLSEAGSSAELHNKQQEDPETFTGENISATDDLCKLPLENKDVQVIDIECGTPVEVGGFDSSKSKNEMVCSSMDSMMDPGIHTDVLPGIQDGYSLAFSDFLGADISCYPSMQSDLHAGIGVNDSEGIAVMDDPIYGSLTDIGFMDVWGQPTQDYDKFF